MSKAPLILTARQRHRLQRRVEETRDAHTHRRTLAPLEVSRGRPGAQVAETLGVARRSIYSWIEHYRQGTDPSALSDGHRCGRPGPWTEDLRVLLRTLMADYSPDQLGYPAVDWTVALLQEHLETCTGRRLSDDTIRRELDRLGYVGERSRYVLEPDPESEKKTADPPPDPGLAAPERAAG